MSNFVEEPFDGGGVAAGLFFPKLKETFLCDIGRQIFIPCTKIEVIPKSVEIVVEQGFEKRFSHLQQVLICEQR